jgi:seryl-tRNA synthetase
MTMPTTKERVPAHTAESVNERIRQETQQRVRKFAAQPAGIAARLKELDEEWDIERAIEMNASALAFIGTALGFFVHPYWLLLPALVTAFLFQHAVQGWCPPVPVLRRMGFRTVYEIEQERQALKALRGDYAQVAAAQDKPAAALTAAQA